MTPGKQTEEKRIRSDHKQKPKRGCVLCLILAAALAILIRIALNESLTVREYTVTSPLVTGDHTFAVLSDLHGTIYGEEQEKLAEKVKKFAPEAVFLVGDILDEESGAEEAVLLLRKLEGTPVWYVTGNHERYLPYTDDAKALMREYGVRTLSGETVDLGCGIRLSGVDDPLFFWDLDFFKELKKTETSAETFDILLAHRPYRVQYYLEQGFDLTLCGHTHGGQVRFPPFLNGLYAPNEGWFPEYAGGRYDFPEGGCMIVSRGLERNGIPRVFNPPEVVIVHVNEEH